IRFAGKHRFHIPPSFYDALRHPSFSPSLHQMYALSILSGYRLADWLEVFGFSMDDPARFQASWSHERTVELDPQIYDRYAEIVGFEERHPIVLAATPTPVNHWLSGRVIQSLDSLSIKTIPSFRYLQIGSHDAYAFPDLLPGSIVRIDGRIPIGQLQKRE